jgi:nucleoid-associated protein YgaU
MAFTTHTVKYGERWDNIAKIQYGDERYTPEIQMANPEIPLDEPIPAGTVLRIPIKEIAERNIELLPPWKR